MTDNIGRRPRQERRETIQLTSALEALLTGVGALYLASNSVIVTGIGGTTATAVIVAWLIRQP